MALDTDSLSVEVDAKVKSSGISHVPEYMLAKTGVGLGPSHTSPDRAQPPLVSMNRPTREAALVTQAEPVLVDAVSASKVEKSEYLLAESGCERADPGPPKRVEVCAAHCPEQLFLCRSITYPNVHMYGAG